MADSSAPRPVPSDASAPLPGPSTHVEEPVAADVEAVLALADRAHEVDGHPPLSDQTRGMLARGRQAWWGLTRSEDGTVTGVAALAPVSDPAGPVVLELVVDPTWRGHGLGAALAEAAATAVRERGLEDRTSVWAHGMLPGSADLAARHGLRPVRELRRMRLERPALEAVPAPVPHDEVRVRAFDPERDAAAWLELNAEAFAHHPEQGGMTAADLADRMEQDWFDPAGFLLAERAGEGPDAGELLGFHWTKVEAGPGSVGEVYVLGVSPRAQGMGLGRALTLAGLRHLEAVPVSAVDLYVDADNTAAVALYASLGFDVSAADVQYRADADG